MGRERAMIKRGGTMAFGDTLSCGQWIDFLGLIG
jgi:hypothetical protein